MNGVPSASSCRMTGSATSRVTRSTNSPLAAEAAVEPGERRVRAHAAGVGALVAVEQALVVLRGAEGQHVVAVAEEEERHLGAGEELLHEHRPRRQIGVGVGERRLAVGRDDDALAGGEPVGLHDVRGAELVERGLDLGAAGGAHRAAGRHARGIHDPLRERLRALELRGGLARTEHRDAALAHRIGDACDQRRLGADDHEVDEVLVGERRDGGGVFDVEGDQLRVLPDAGVAGGREDLVLGLLRPQREDDGVLPRARAEDQDLHALQPTDAPRRVSVLAGVVGHRGRIGGFAAAYGGGVARRISTDDGRAALSAVAAAAAASVPPARTDNATAVRYLLQLLAEKAPGNSVEVRVPPFGAVQVHRGPAAHARNARRTSSRPTPRPGSRSRPAPSSGRMPQPPAASAPRARAPTSPTCCRCAPDGARAAVRAGRTTTFSTGEEAPVMAGRRSGLLSRVNRCAVARHGHVEKSDQLHGCRESETGASPAGIAWTRS